MHAVRHPVDALRARVDLEREATTGRTGGTEQPGAAAMLRRAHDARAEKQHAAELRGVEWLRRHRHPRENRRGAHPSRRQFPRQHHRRQPGWILLDLRRQRLYRVVCQISPQPLVVGSEYLPTPRRVHPRQSMQQPGARIEIHTVSMPHLEQRVGAFLRLGESGRRANGGESLIDRSGERPGGG